MLSKLQARWRRLRERERELRMRGERKYGTPWYVYVPCGQRAKIDDAGKRADEAMNAIFAWLDEHSPRAWRSGVAAYWVAESLTEADALTVGQLEVLPACGYGSLPCDVLRFAAPVRAGCPA